METIDLLQLAFVLLANAYLLRRFRNPRHALVAMLLFDVVVVGMLAHRAMSQPIPAHVASQAPARAPARREVPPSVRRAPRGRVLAVLAWAEAGARVAPGEIAAFDAVVRNRSTERSYTRIAWAYSAGLRNRRHAWLFRLDPDAVPATLPEYVRTEWPRVLRAAEAVARGEVEHECDGRLLHWGGPRVDARNLERLMRRGYRRARCPEAYANAFLARRRR